MNEGNGYLLDRPEQGGVPQERLDSSLESAIKEATLKLVELSDGNSISIRMSEFNVSSSPSSNFIPSIDDNSLESYLIGDTDRKNDSTRCIENVTKIDNCSISSPVKTSGIVDESNQSSTVAVTTNLHQTSTGFPKPIGEILKGLNFVTPRKVTNVMKNDLLYIQEQMPKTKQMPRRPRGQGQGGFGRSPTRVPPVGRGRGKGNGPPSAVPGKHDWKKIWWLQ